MSLVLRSIRLSAVVTCQERLANHQCLNSLQRIYVTSSGLQPKEKKASKQDCPDDSITQANKVESMDVNEKLVEPLTKPKNVDKSEEMLKGKEAILAKASDRMAKAKMSSQQVRDNVKGYVFTQYFDYVKNYDKLLEKNFPSAMKVYRVFFDGVKEFFSDMKSYLKIQRIINEKGIKSLNRKELELYMQMPKDMFKMAPTLIFSSLPLVGYAVFPLVFMFPRLLLTSHFWSNQQRLEFKQMKFQERLSYNRPVLRCLQMKLSSIEKHDKHKELATILGQLGSGTHPNVKQILEVRDVFAHPPYNLITLTRKHLKVLVQMHGASRSIFKRHSLYEHAYLVHYMDLAICREGGVHNMPTDDIKKACFIRGLNPENMSNEEMITWLRDWIQVSTSIQGDHLTLFLHLPIFLAYNHPNNWRLIYTEKQNSKNISAK